MELATETPPRKPSSPNASALFGTVSCAANVGGGVKMMNIPSVAACRESYCPPLPAGLRYVSSPHNKTCSRAGFQIRNGSDQWGKSILLQINDNTFFLARALRSVGTKVRLRGFERLLRAVFDPDIQHHYPFHVSFDKFVYPAYADNIVDWNVLFYGSYETFEINLLASLADRIPDASFVDVGANVGHHALFMAAHASTVHAFEPNPSMWPLIEEKLSVNGVTNVILHRCGLGPVNGNLPLYLGTEQAEASLLIEANRNRPSNPVMVSILRGDDFFPANKIDRIDIIKMDIEGFEKHAIDGLKNQLARTRPLMMVEMSETGKIQFGDFAAFVAAFPEDYDFHFCRMGPDLFVRYRLHPANERSYSNFIGNVFCIPGNRRGLFAELTRHDIAPS